VAVEIHKPIGSAAQELFAGISASSYLDVEQTIADRRYSPSLAIAGVVAPEVNMTISCAAQVSMALISAAMDNDVVQPAADTFQNPSLTTREVIVAV